MLSSRFPVAVNLNLPLVLMLIFFLLVSDANRLGRQSDCRKCEQVCISAFLPLMTGYKEPETVWRNQGPNWIYIVVSS